jgi:hypothetical protein
MKAPLRPRRRRAVPVDAGTAALATAGARAHGKSVEDFASDLVMKATGGDRVRVCGPNGLKAYEIRVEGFATKGVASIVAQEVRLLLVRLGVAKAGG